MSTEGAAVSWRRLVGVRIAGSAASWFFVTLGLGLLFAVTGQVMAVGGSCASGGPYEIAVECPPGVELLTPLALVSAGLGIAVMVVIVPDFGVSLVAFGWLLLFGGLGAYFLQAFVDHGDPAGLVVGIVFGVMGVGPLVFLLVSAPRAVFLGRAYARGRLYAPDGAQHPRVVDYVVSIGIWLVGSAAGFVVAGLVAG